MFELIKAWCRKYFADPQAGVLLFILLLAILILALFGKILAPLLAGLVLAYLLDSVVKPLNKWCKIPHLLAVIIVFLVFIGVVVLFFLWMVPLFYKQSGQIINEAPVVLHSFHIYLQSLPQKYPFISKGVVHDLIASTQFSSDKIAKITPAVLNFSLNSLPNIMTWVVYVFLVPLLTLFFMKDKNSLIKWMVSFAPQDRGLLVKVCDKMHRQLGNYVRGKALEVIIVWAVTYIGMRVFNLNYALLLSFFVGLSVIIPYVGVVVVTIPVVLIGVLQFGLSSTFLYMIIVYLIIQMLDGFLLVPLLFSEAVNLHPVAIIASVLFFGGIWGFWGVFFAIPLATLVAALTTAWSEHARQLI